MPCLRPAENIAALLIGTAHDFLNAASGASSAAKRAIKRQHLVSPSDLAALREQIGHLQLRIAAFCQVHCEVLHDQGRQQLLDRLYITEALLAQTQAGLQSLRP